VAIMEEVDYDPVYDRLDAMYDEPPEPNCWGCYDYRRPGVYCSDCKPSPRQRRRAKHRAWLFRDRASRSLVGKIADAFGVPVDMLGSPF
jgi:hypothetical protein